MNKNQKLADYTISPVESFRWIENAFFQHLQRVKFNLRDEMKKFRNKYKETFEKTKNRYYILSKMNLIKEMLISL